MLVLSDLKEEGFAMLDRFEGLNEAATLLVLERIAKFHAVSLVYRKKFGEFGPFVQQKYMRPEIVDVSRNFAERSTKMLIEATEDWGMDEKILDSLRSVQKVFMAEFIAGTDPDTAHPDDFQVLCHGDLWLNNMMFKEGNDVLLVRDFERRQNYLRTFNFISDRLPRIALEPTGGGSALLFYNFGES